MILKDFKIIKNDLEDNAEEILLKEVKKTKKVLLLTFLSSLCLSIISIFFEVLLPLFIIAFIVFFFSLILLFGNLAGDGLIEKMGYYSAVELAEGYAFDSKKVNPIILSCQLSNKEIVQLNFDENELIYKEDNEFKYLKLRINLNEAIKIEEDATITEDVLDLNKMILYIKKKDENLE